MVMVVMVLVEMPKKAQTATIDHNYDKHRYYYSKRTRRVIECAARDGQEGRSAGTRKIIEPS